MSESEIVLLAMIVLLALLAWMQAQEIRSLRIRAQEADLWCERWEELAQQAAEEAEQAARRHAHLQDLYCNLVRQRLAASTWIVVGRETRR